MKATQVEGLLDPLLLEPLQKEENNSHFNSMRKKSKTSEVSEGQTLEVEVVSRRPINLHLPVNRLPHIRTQEVHNLKLKVKKQ